MVAGEASGDLHGALLIEELKKRRPDFSFYGIGGDRMQKQGVELLYHARDLAIMGFFEVFGRLLFFRRVFNSVVQSLPQRKPDMAILIDYPGFNLRLAEKLKQAGVPVVYYIAPQIWAWRARRIEQIKKSVDLMLVILPFEETLYRRAGVPVFFVGHPLLGVVKPTQTRQRFRSSFGLDEKTTLIGLLPGSRQQEIEKILPIMMKTVSIARQRRPDIKGAVGLAEMVSRSVVAGIIAQEGTGNFFLVENATYDLMHHSDLLLVSSGTATLESAIAGTPLVVLYKTNWLTYVVARRVVTIPHIALVNVIAGTQVVPEFIQHAPPPKIAGVVLNLLFDLEKKMRLKEQLRQVRSNLGLPGAAGRAAEQIIKLMGA